MRHLTITPFFTLLAAVAAAAGQSPTTTITTPRGFGDLMAQAPPHVDKALRDRINRFYLLHQQKQWRAADALVHAESKDAFFSLEKSAFRGFKIVRIAYRENFTNATVVVDIDTDMFFPGFGLMQVNRPLTSFWRFDQNEWWWHVVPVDCKETPWNLMYCGGGPPDIPDGGRVAAGLPDFPKVLADLKSRIKVDKTEILLPRHEAAEAEVVIANHWESSVHLTVDFPALTGLSLQLDNPHLPSGETTKLRIASRPRPPDAVPGPSQLTARLTVAETGTVIELKIAYRTSKAIMVK